MDIDILGVLSHPTYKGEGKDGTVFKVWVHVLLSWGLILAAHQGRLILAGCFA